MIGFGRDIASDERASTTREWLVTNGIGGYASGTIAGLLTRRYHGLLVATLKPPVARTLLLTKLDETASYDGVAYPLHTNRLRSAETPLAPRGFERLERFCLEGTIPVWTFVIADALLEKRVWMQRGANTTYIRYDLVRATGPFRLDIEALVNHRDHHDNMHAAEGARAIIEPVSLGLKITLPGNVTPLYLLSEVAEATPRHEWRRDFFLSVEDYRGLDPLDDDLHAADLTATLKEGESLTVVASTSPDSDMRGRATLTVHQGLEERLLGMNCDAGSPEPLLRLVLAADQFIVRRTVRGDPDGRSVIAGYHWFSDWGRDTMIALPGLTLETRRGDVAGRILRTFAAFIDKGVLPNRFPDHGETPEYNTVDATLWYFEAIRAYLAATSDDALLPELYPILLETIDWYRRGTHHNIHVDPEDSLVYSGEPGVQLTWMDAKYGDQVFTPRTGKAVEINALWYNALRSMAVFARNVGEPSDPYDALADLVQKSFSRFWNESRGYCCDVIDSPGGDDASLRPNQLFAVSLHHSPLDADKQRAVVDVCARHLLTPYGLRSLAPDDPRYVGRHGGPREVRDAAYHQGTVWSWLIGPFVSAHFRVYDDVEAARSFLLPLLDHMTQGCVGSISEIFDGDAPHAPRGCIAQAWSVAELLRAWRETVSPYRERLGAVR